MSPAAEVGIVVGSSRGLGAALVRTLLDAGMLHLLGIGRSPVAAVTDPRCSHLQLDVAAPDAPEKIEAAVAALPTGRLLVIFNAALVQSDLRGDGSIDWPTAEEVSRTGVQGLLNTLHATSSHLLARGGILVGISSYAALAPPVRDPRLSYPASKAYLDMALRVLRQHWRGRVHVVTVHLGNMGLAQPTGWDRLLRPSYAMAAQRIVTVLGGPRVPGEIGYPWPYALVYRWLLPLVPDRLYFTFFERLLGATGRR